MKVKIYGKEGCSFCKKALALADNLRQDGFLEEIEYIDYQKEAVDLNAVAGIEVKSVPVIVLNDKYIGGFREFKGRFAAYQGVKNGKFRTPYGPTPSNQCRIRLEKTGISPSVFLITAGAVAYSACLLYG